MEKENQMREILWKYLKQFKKLYPTHPEPATWDIYERALADVSDLDLAGACEICLREVSYFPMIAQIRERLRKPDDFVCTAQSYPDNPPGDEEKREFNEGMEILKNQLGIKPQLIRPKLAPTVPWKSDVNYIAMVGTQTLQG